MPNAERVAAVPAPPRLTLELVPETCWASNVRSLVSLSDWGRIRVETLAKTGHQCEICGDRGRLECHEVWDYDDAQHVQRLVRMIALCPACHEVKHLGLARVKGRGPVAMRHLMHVNGWSESHAETYVEQARAHWRERSKHQWSLNLDALADFGVNVGTLTPDVRPPAKAGIGPRARRV